MPWRRESKKGFVAAVFLQLSRLLFTFSPPGSLEAGALRAPLAAAAAMSGAVAVEAAEAAADTVADVDADGGQSEAKDRDLRASATAELSEANAAARGKGCCLLESPDISERD